MGCACLLLMGVTCHPTGPGNPCVVDEAPVDAIVAWEDDRDGNGVYEIMAQLMRRDGSFAGPDFTVNQVSQGQQI